MKLINWNTDKNIWLRENRGICFEDIIYFIENELIIDDVVNPNNDKYPNQRIMILDINKYIYLVLYVESDKEIFLKTIIPTRKGTKKYLGGNK